MCIRTTRKYPKAFNYGVATAIPKLHKDAINILTYWRPSWIFLSCEKRTMIITGDFLVCYAHIAQEHMPKISSFPYIFRSFPIWLYFPIKYCPNFTRLKVNIERNEAKHTQCNDFMTIIETLQVSCMSARYCCFCGCHCYDYTHRQCDKVTCSNHS